jgi:GAF domain
MAGEDHDEAPPRADHDPRDVPVTRQRPRRTESRLFRGVGVLCETAVQLTGADGAAVAVMMSPQSRELVYATDDLAKEIDELQFVVGEGPCFDAYHLQWPQLWPDLDPDPRQDRWLAFSAGVQDLGVEAVFAFPVPGPLGVLELYRRAPGPLGDDQVDSATTCAEAIGSVVRASFPVTRGVIAEANAEAASLHPSNPFSRAQVHQACTVVAQLLNIPTDEAIARIRAHAYAQNMSTGEAAAEILAGRFPLHEWGEPSGGQEPWAR